MGRTVKLLWSMLSFLALHAVFAWRNFEVEFSNITCNFDEAVFERFVCRVGRNKENISTVYANFTPKADFMLNDLHTVAFLTNNGTRIPFVDVSLNGCEYLKNGGKGAALSFVFRALQKYSNFAEGCPMKKGHAYYMADLQIDPETFPGYMPELTLTHIVVFKQDGKQALYYEVLVDLTPKSKKAGKKRAKQTYP